MVLPPLGAGDALVVSVQNVSGATALSVRVADVLAPTVTLAEDSDDAPVVTLQGPRPAGAVLVEVSHTGSSGRSGDLYVVEVTRE